jgi:glycosyltransferase involved in cell wall biosynthesis
MQIIHVLPNLSKGGAEQVAIDLANQQVDEGHRVALLFANKNHSPVNYSKVRNEIEVYYVSQINVKSKLVYISSLMWLIRNHKTISSFDVIHTHLTFGLLTGTYSRILSIFSSKKRPKLVFTCHLVGMNVSFSLRTFTLINSLFYDNFVLMAHDEYWDRIIGKSEKFSFVENGIKPIIVERKRISKKFRIGSLGRLVKDRNPELTLDLFLNIQQELKHTRCVIGGDGPLKQFLQNSILASGVGDGLELLGFVETPSEFYEDLDLYISLNVGSTTGIAGLEAISCGVPTLAIQLNKEYMSGSGDWIPSFIDRYEMTDFISKMIEEDGLLEELAIKQKSTFESKFTVDVMAAKYIAIYSK